MEKTSEKSEPKIYVACLAAYNSGRLHGAWIRANQDENAIRAEIAVMLSRSPIVVAEEYAIHDFEGFEGATVGEYTSVGAVAAMASFIVEHGELGGAVLAHFGGNLDEAREALESRYLGQYQSLADYAEQTVWSSIVIPESLQYYIDWDAMARDWEINGDYFVIEESRSEVHIFSGQ